jgi:hypothetical protein
MKNFLFLLMAISIVFVSCDINPQQQKSDSGVTKASVTVKTGIDGLTAEQRNITKRLTKDNEPGSIKHLYIISAYTGDVLQYSTVDGKVTSGGKRLSPKTVNGNSTVNSSYYLNFVKIGGENFITDEVLDDGGTYGDSGNYLYWFDAQGNYQQYYPSGGTYLQISDRPLRVKKSTLSLELFDEPAKTK